MCPIIIVHAVDRMKRSRDAEAGVKESVIPHTRSEESAECTAECELVCRCTTEHLLTVPPGAPPSCNRCHTQQKKPSSARFTSGEERTSLADISFYAGASKQYFLLFIVCGEDRTKPPASSYFDRVPTDRATFVRFCTFAFLVLRRTLATRRSTTNCRFS